MNKMSIYNSLPIWGQNLACYYEGRRIKNTRYGAFFNQKLNEYEERNDWRYEQKCKFRDKKLAEMIIHCYSTIPYYRRLFDNYGVKPESINSIDDLKRLPILSKDEVKKHIMELISKKYKSKEIVIFPTGGTTGSGLKFHSTENELQEQWAVWWRYRRRNGIDLNTKCGIFGGKQIVPLSQIDAPFWRFNNPNHQVCFSSYHISEQNAEKYATFLQESGIQWIHGYASSISELASYLNDKGITLPMRWVSVGSENLYRSQEEEIVRAFKVKPIQHYGLTEGVANFSEMKSGVYTVDEDFACVEFLPTDVTNEYKIIGTALTKFVMPLIRYDTGDVAVISNYGKHNNDGRIIDFISGRSIEYVKLPSGGKVGAASISLAVHDYHFIREMQIIQKKLNHITVCIVKNANANDYNERLLKESLQERFGKDMTIDISYVDSLIKSSSGKSRLVISELS